MIELFDYWFNQGGDLDLTEKHLSEFVNLTTFLCKQDGTFLSCHSDDNGYECVNQISAFIHSYFGKRDEFPTKIIRNNNCEIVFDTYGDKNLSPEVAKILQLKSAEINEAYAYLSKKAA